jgi:fatty acid desaturase
VILPKALAKNDWFRPSIERNEIRKLARRSDVKGWQHFGTWIALMVVSATSAIHFWGHLTSVPFLALYGALYAMSDQQTHDLAHGTAFRHRLPNEFLYCVNAWMTLHEPRSLRWGHLVHHSDTLETAVDPERVVQPTTNLLFVAADFFFIPTGKNQLRFAIATAIRGQIRSDVAHLIPDSETSAVVRNRRIQLSLIALVVLASIALASWIPIVLLVTPRFWGGPLSQLINITGHAGKDENSRDHRRSCRTVLLNPVLRFFCMNANYHVEHHLMPSVPFHALPRLHLAIRDQLPPPATSLHTAYAEIYRLTVSARANAQSQTNAEETHGLREHHRLVTDQDHAVFTPVLHRS